MPRTQCIAKRDFLPFFRTGDLITIVPVLYEEDTLIRGKLWGLYQDGKLVRFVYEYRGRKLPENQELRKESDALYAPKGSYKSSYIELADGRQYPSTLVHDFTAFFEKIKPEQINNSMKNFNLGDKVTRINSGNDTGRTGNIVDVNETSQRARILWGHSGIRTWVAFRFLQITNPITQ